MLSGENWCWSLLGPKGLRLCEGLWHFPVSMLSVIMCGSRKYPYPPPPPTTEDHWKFWGGGGVQRQLFPRGRGVHGKQLFQRVTNHEQNSESNVQSTVSTKTYVHCFETKITTPGHWDEVNIISFNVSVFLWVSWRYNLQKNDVSLERSRNDFKWRTWLESEFCPQTSSFVSFLSDQHFSAFSSVHWASLFATFTCRKRSFDTFCFLSVVIRGSNS